MAGLEDVPEIGINFWYLSVAGEDGFNSFAEGSIFVVSSTLALYHMAKCVWHARRVWQITRNDTEDLGAELGVAGLSTLVDNGAFSGAKGELLTR